MGDVEFGGWGQAIKLEVHRCMWKLTNKQTNKQTNKNKTKT
jgi:hypothetical protein